MVIFFFPYCSVPAVGASLYSLLSFGAVSWSVLAGLVLSLMGIGFAVHAYLPREVLLFSSIRFRFVGVVIYHAGSRRCFFVCLELYQASVVAYAIAGRYFSVRLFDLLWLGSWGCLGWRRPQPAQSYPPTRNVLSWVRVVAAVLRPRYLRAILQVRFLLSFPSRRTIIRASQMPSSAPRWICTLSGGARRWCISLLRRSFQPLFHRALLVCSQGRIR